MTGRNEPCPCGSGRKFKQCHGAAPPGADDDPERALPSVLRWLSDRHWRALQDAITNVVASWWPDEIEMRGLLRSYEANEAEMAREQGRRAVDFAFPWEAVGLTRR
jgi:hypothetical protein